MEYEVIVVGGGIGGLATGALLAARGLHVGLFERQSRVGGCVANFEHLGYMFEPTAGLYSGWESGGIWEQIFSELTLTPPAISKLSPNFVVRLPDGRDVAVCDQPETFEHELATAFPDGASSAIDFFRHVDQIKSGAQLDAEVLELLNAASPQFRLFVEAQIQALAQCSLADCSGERAAAALTSARRGMWAIDGGAQALADRLAECLKRSGGTLRLDSPVLRLAYATDGTPVGIDLLSGERVIANGAIVSNLTIWDTYGKLIGLSRTPKSISAELRNSWGWGAYLVFLGMDEAASPRLPASRMLIGSDSSNESDAMPLALNVAPESNARAPAGKRAATVATLTRAEDWFSFHEDEAAHEEQDQATLESLWGRLHSAMPELGDAVEVIETATPRTIYETTRRRLGMIGSALGASNPAARPFGITRFRNVFMVGDTACIGIGLEGVARSALALVDELAPQP
jgi:phytoene dehydrogenase-like protein